MKFGTYQTMLRAGTLRALVAGMVWSFIGAMPGLAGLTITITGSGPTDTMPTIAFSGSGAFGASTFNFLQLTAADLGGGQYVNSTFNNQQVNLTGGALTLEVFTSGNVLKWSDTVDFFLFDNDGADATPTGGELDIVFNSTNSVLAGDLYVFSGTAQLKLSDSPLVDTTFSAFNNGNYSTNSTGVVLSATPNTVMDGEPVTVTIVPEPSSLMLIFLGMATLTWLKIR